MPHQLLAVKFLSITQRARKSKLHRDGSERAVPPPQVQPRVVIGATKSIHGRSSCPTELHSDSQRIDESDPARGMAI
jgi:hypothetical protein